MLWKQVKLSQRRLIEKKMSNHVFKMGGKKDLDFAPNFPGPEDVLSV